MRTTLFNSVPPLGYYETGKLQDDLLPRTPMMVNMKKQFHFRLHIKKGIYFSIIVEPKS